MAKKVLVVDDDKDFVLAVRTVLEKGGFDVESVYSGQECLDQVGTVNPDLIVLDVMMPGMDGWEVCETLKEGSETGSIPIILLTSVASNVPKSSYTHADARSTQADDYMPKPLKPANLLQNVRRLLA